MEPESRTVNSEVTWTAFITYARKMFDEHKYITFPKPRIGPDRSLDQNALLHVWLTEYAAFLLHKDKKQVTPGELDGIKNVAKGRYYNETGDVFMVHIITNPFNGKTKTAFTSSASWKRGEAFKFLTWLQMMAANDGLVLESKGEYKKLQREQNA